MLLSHLYIALLIIAIFAMAVTATADTPGPLTVDRVAGYQYTIVTTNNTRPNSCLMTYKNETGDAANQHLLAKIVPGVEVNGEVIWTSGSSNVNVNDLPGAVEVSYNVKGVKVHTVITSLLQGNAKSWEGAAVYKITTKPSTPLVLRIGGGRDAFMHFNPVDWIVTDETEFEGATVALNGQTAFLHSTKHPLVVAIKTSGEIAKLTGANNAEYITVKFPSGTGAVVLSYSKEEPRAEQLANLDLDKEIQTVTDHYKKLFASAVLNTPEKVMNNAFKTALYNLEYNYMEPVGWVESLHHWTTLWHMQHTGGAQWLGQLDRVKDCLLSHAKMMYPDGSIPHLSPTLLPRRDFGGTNQYYLWEIKQFLDFAGDVKTLEKLAPAVYGAVEESFKEADPDGDGLLCWGLQIGNQEDFVLTPYNGTAPAVEGINMLKTAAMVASILEDNEKAQAYQIRAENAIAELHKQLWMRDLGRYAFYKDPTGRLALDGPYQAMIYPVIWSITDPFDSYTSIRHLRDRLMGPNGEVYASNMFPDHLTDLWATWGMQAGAAQQPWGAWGLAKVGLRNETYRPLKAVANWVMSDFQKGSWPEVANEPRLGYFSPPAGLYVQAVTEALFGLYVKKFEKALYISPSFPDSWPEASLSLPAFKAEYNRKGNTLEYSVTSKEKLARRLSWMLPVCSVNEVFVDGKKADFNVKPGVGCVILELDTPASTHTRFTVRMTPLKYTVSAPKSIAEGDLLVLNVSGAQIERVDDRCSVLSGIRTISNNGIKARVREGQLEDYDGYGRLGQLTFSRRTFFLECRAKDVRFYQPVDLAILPRIEAAPVGEVIDGTAKILIRNNTSSPIEGTSRLFVSNKNLAFEIGMPARSEEAYSIKLDDEILSSLSPGDNKAELLIPGLKKIDLAITASKLFADDAPRLESVRSRMAQIDIPTTALTSIENWSTVKAFYSQRCLWDWPMPPMESIKDKTEYSLSELPGVVFKLNSGGLVVLSRRIGNPEFVMDLGNVSYKKLYLFVAGLIDNQSLYLPTADISLQLTKSIYPQIGTQYITRTLKFPGDLDWWSDIIYQRLATFHGPRNDRLGLLPILKADSSDWKTGQPPAFPQPEYWSRALATKIQSAVLNVIEIDLGKPTSLQSLRISMPSTDPAIGLIAITGEKSAP